MNSLIITLSILIIAETEILLVANSPLVSQRNRLSGYSSSGPTLNQLGQGDRAQEEDYLNNAGTYQVVLEVLGSYSYIDNEGNTFQVSYIANEDGFQPKGANLPTVPSLIKKALRYIAEHSEENEKE